MSVLRKPPDLPTFSQADSADGLATFGLASLVAGIVYLGAFAPLTAVSAKHAGLSVIDAFLLVGKPVDLPADFFDRLFPRFSIPEARPFVYGLASLYGAIGLVTAVALLVQGFPKLIVMGYGLAGGMALTVLLGSEHLGVLALRPVSKGMLFAQIGYVLLLYYAAHSLTRLFSRDDLALHKFDFLFAGLYGVVQANILSRQFGADAVMFTGLLGIAVTFLSITAAEAVFRPLFRLLQHLLGPVNWAMLANERALTGGHFRTALAAVRSDPTTSAIAVAVFVGFPAFVAVVYHFVLEGRL